FALSAVGVELDYEVETLPVLDAYLRVAAAGLADRPEAEPIVTRAVAAYFGEVVRRRMDGFWRHREDPNDEWELCARRALLSMSEGQVQYFVPASASGTPIRVSPGTSTSVGGTTALPKKSRKET